MKRVLSDYLEIYHKFRTGGLSKLERKQRHTLLSEWEKTEYDDELVNISDIQEFWNNHNNICWNKLFISKVICPVIAADLEIGGYEGLKFLFQCFRGHEGTYVSSDSPLAIFCEYSGYKYQPVQLANFLLEQDHNNIDALKYKYNALKYFLEFSIHEIPSCVLNGMDGASVSDIPEMLKDINEFECISKKLNMPLCETLITDCRRYYKAYEDYLLHIGRYRNFEDYLRSNGILYQSCTLCYDYK